MKNEYTLKYIRTKVCSYYNIPEDLIFKKTRKREIVKARQICQYFGKEKVNTSLSFIGYVMGDKDHATVLHSHRVVNNEIDTNKKYKQEIEQINKMIKLNITVLDSLFLKIKEIYKNGIIERAAKRYLENEEIKEQINQEFNELLFLK
jgi:hypothetical protein